jgi:4-cresol dehydrogenase (hydroxylating)
MSQNFSELIMNVLAKSSTLTFDCKQLKKAIRGTEGLEYFTHKKRNVLAIVTITETQEIKALIDLANQCASNQDLAFTLYPISTGKNWGYGSSQPSGTEQNIVLLDLGQLNNIKNFDPELGLVTLEPGVTQQQLSHFLQDHNYQYMVPVTGAGPECSILANALERGYGITPHTDHFGAVTSIQGYWANGTAYHSAIDELDQSTEKLVDKTYKWGLGPYLEGLFTQSNLGIVSQLTLRLAIRKSGFSSFFIQLDSDNSLDKVIPIVRKILQDYEGIVGAINVMDQRRLLSMLSQNPDKNTHKVMSEEKIKALSTSLKVPCWTVVGSIYGSKGVVKVVKKEISKRFKTLPCRQIYSDSLSLITANKIMTYTPTWFIDNINILSKLSQQLTAFQQGKNIMLGIPNKVALQLAYWRHQNPEKFARNSLSPGDDGCGILWYAPLISMKVEVIREFVSFVRTTCPKYNIEPFITLTNLKHDCVDSTIPIVFDATNPKAINDAHQCLEALTKEGLKLGFVPYRINIDQQQWLLDKNSNFWKTVELIKKTLDPNDILSAARYNPR